MKRLRLGLIALLAVAILVASVLYPAGYRRHRVCIDCGLYSQRREFFGVSIPWGERRRPMTDWYDRRIGKAHTHRWGWTGCGAILNVWQGTVGYGCGGGEPLAQDGDLFVEVLKRLEDFDLDQPVYRALTHVDRDHREAAADAVLLGPWEMSVENEHTIRTWWDKAQEYLGDPDAWPSGFGD